MTSTNIVVVTGLSGSGKSTAIRALEDVGYFCIDNLPAELFTKFLDLVGNSTEPMESAALVMDARESNFLEHCEEIIEKAQNTRHNVRILYLTCDTDTIVRRYKETRRRHPLDAGGGLRAAVKREREALSPLQHLANHVVDTTRLNVHELRREIAQLLAPNPGTTTTLSVQVLSFGFKHGVPSEVDLVFDVRFLDNPYFSPALRQHTGKHPDVSSFVLNQAAAQTFLSHLQSMLAFLIPLYAAEGKSYLTIGIGCTGGQHRSVAIAEQLATRLSPIPHPVRVKHRDAREKTA